MVEKTLSKLRFNRAGFGIQQWNKQQQQQWNKEKKMQEAIRWATKMSPEIQSTQLDYKLGMKENSKWNNWQG